MKRGGAEEVRDAPLPVFPGGIAGASLKRAQVVERQPLALLVFPGGIAGASLKLRPAAVDDVRVASPFSPAESPGPH